MTNRDKTSSIIFFLVVTLVAILGGFFVYRATHWSPWAFSDSAAYLSAARNFGDGRGLVILNSNGTTTRMTEFAPLYPILLSLFTGQSGDFIETARWLNIIAFALTIFLSGFFTFKITRTFIASCCVSLFVALSPIMLDAFTGMMSEPIFILLLIIQFLYLWSYISQPNWKSFLPMVIVSLLLPLTRYAGIVFPLSAGILLTLLGKKGFKRNLLLGLSFAAITLLPIGIWFLDLFLKLDKVGGKSFSFDLAIFSSFFRSVISEYLVLRTWFPYYGIYPGKTINLIIEVFFTILFFSVFSIGVYRVIKSWKSLENRHLSFLIGITHVLLYLAFIALTHSITIPQIDIINRMLAPVLPLSLMALAAVFSMETQRKSKIPWQLPLAVLLIISARYNYLITAQKISDYYENGFGFNSREIQQSGFINALHELDREKPMISNSAAFVLFHTNRFPLDVYHFHNRTYGSSDGYGEKTFREKHAPLIIHLPDFRNSYGADADDLLKTLTTDLDMSFADMIGAIYYYPN